VIILNKITNRLVHEDILLRNYFRDLPTHECKHWNPKRIRIYCESAHYCRITLKSNSTDEIRRFQKAYYLGRHFAFFKYLSEIGKAISNHKRFTGEILCQGREDPVNVRVPLTRARLVGPVAAAGAGQNNANAIGNPSKQLANRQPAKPQNGTDQQPNGPTSVKELFNSSSCVEPPFTCPHPRIQFFLYTRWAGAVSKAKLRTLQVRIGDKEKKRSYVRSRPKGSACQK